MIEEDEEGEGAEQQPKDKRRAQEDLAARRAARKAALEREDEALHLSLDQQREREEAEKVTDLLVLVG